MQKTRMGISVGLMGAATYLCGLFGGLMVTVVIAGYILLFEENAWLKRAAVKSVALLLFFSAVIAVINLIPNTVSLIDSIVSIGGLDFRISPVTSLISAIVSAIQIIEKLLFLALGSAALGQGTVRFPVVDKLLDKHM